MLEMVKAQLEAGILKKWGVCYDLSGGYGFSELSVTDLYAYLSQWVPHVQFDVKPFLM